MYGTLYVYATGSCRPKKQLFFAPKKSTLFPPPKKLWLESAYLACNCPIA